MQDLSFNKNVLLVYYITELACHFVEDLFKSRFKGIKTQLTVKLICLVRISCTVNVK